MLNSQLKILNRAILKNLKDNQHYIGLPPLKIEVESVKSLNFGDIIYFDKLSFIIRTRHKEFGDVELAKDGFEEGFLIKKLCQKDIKMLDSDSNYVTLDIRVVAISISDIKKDNWIGFGWSVSSCVTIFIDDSLWATGRLVEIEKGFGVEILTTHSENHHLG